MKTTEKKISLPQVINYAIACHRDTNHLYDGKPYQVHLQMVVDTAMKFIHLIPEKDRDTVIAACWLHDTIEDCRVTYNDVKNETNETVAELVFALTNEKGRARKDRANSKYYQGIRSTLYATFIKLCDRIANVTYSKEKRNTKKDGNSSMFEKYKKENPEFINEMYFEEDQPLRDHLVSIFENE